MHAHTRARMHTHTHTHTLHTHILIPLLIPHFPPDAKMALKESKTTLTDVGVGGVDVEASRTSLMSQSSRQIARQQLAQAREILRLGLENVNYARTAVALNDGKSIADVSWIKVGMGWCSPGVGCWTTGGVPSVCVNEEGNWCSW